MMDARDRRLRTLACAEVAARAAITKDDPITVEQVKRFIEQFGVVAASRDAIVAIKQVIETERQRRDRLAVPE